MPWARRITKNIPSLGSRDQTTEINDYSLGFNSHIANDKFPVKNGGSNMLRYAQDARIGTLGEYSTRKGTDFFSAPAGETEDDTETSTDGASEQDFGTTTWIAQKFTAGATQRLSKVEVNLKNDNNALGTVLVEIYSDDSGAPGVLLATSSIANSDISSSLAYKTARFIEAPDITSTEDYWIVLRTQLNGSSVFTASTTTNSTDALVSTNSGTSWSSQSFSINFRQFYATSGGIKGKIRVYKSDGTATTFFAHGSSLYSVNNSTGALTAVKTGLTSSATNYRFAFVNDILYYVNELDGLRKWDFTTESQVSATNYSNILVHKDLLWLQETADLNKWVFSNFADYETFTSTDFIYVPSPKTGDPPVGAKSLNGYLLFWTQNNKFILSGSDNATFALDEAPDQKGTFTQESIAVDKNFAYFLSNDGVYRTNGSEAQLLSENIYGEILALSNKESAVLAINGGRLYMWVRSSGSAFNDVCYVWNLNYSGSSDTVESYDMGAFVNTAFSCYGDGDTLQVGSSRIGQVYWQELESNDYNNLGAPLSYIVQTHYFVFSSPAVLKEVRYWKPRFEAQSGDYTIDSDYAYDLRNNWQTYQSLSIQGSGVIYGGGAKYGDGSIYGTTQEEQGSLYVPGEYRRIAVRYTHTGARQPNTFYGHTLIVQNRRIR